MNFEIGKDLAKTPTNIFSKYKRSQGRETQLPLLNLIEIDSD